MTEQSEIKSAVDIISAIQRGECDENINKQIAGIDEILFGEIDITDSVKTFLNDFFKAAENTLKTTVNGCINVRNNPEKKDDLKKYKEGYLNEIIQNANDVVSKCGTKNPKIVIECSKEKNEYRLKCTYPDAGFSLTDVYGFCARGNSNKSAEQGQEGMYGIGIKSLFCFATYFCIENNIKIELSTTEKLFDTITIKRLKKDPPKTTTLSLYFQDSDDEESKHADFNVKKITDFIKTLIEGKSCDSFFWDEDETKIIFDPRSLVFTELRKGRTAEKCIKAIEFVAGTNEFKLSVSDEPFTKIKNQNIKISKISWISCANEKTMKYLVFHYLDDKDDENSLSIAYAIDTDWKELKDRIYATYFVSNSGDQLLEKKTGCLVNTRAINSSRSGLERENENAPAILEKIKEKGRETVAGLISILKSDEKDVEWKEYASDVLCHLLHEYGNEYTTIAEEIVPTGIFENKMEELQEVFQKNRLYFAKDKDYIFKTQESDEIDTNNEMINKNRPVNSDEDNPKSLYRIYNEKFIRGDIIFFGSDEFEESSEFEQLCFGIKKLSETIFDPSSRSWLKEIYLPFVDGFKNLMLKRIGGDSFKQILKFIRGCKQEDGVLVKQLVSRFEINKSFDFMGNYSAENVTNWLFASEVEFNDADFKAASGEYENSYQALKTFVEIKKFPVKFAYYSNRADQDYYYNFREFAGEHQIKSQNQEDRINNIDEILSQFLELLDRNVLNIGWIGDGFNKMFFHNHNCEVLTLRNRGNKKCEYSFDCCTLDFLSTAITDFGKFKQFREIIDRFNERDFGCNLQGRSDYVSYYYKQYNENNFQGIFKINGLKKCEIGEANLGLLYELFEWLANYKEKVEVDVNDLSEKIISQDTELIKFSKLYLKNVNIRLENIKAANNGAKFVGYITNINSDHYKIRCRKSANDTFVDINNLNNEKGSAVGINNQITSNGNDEKGSDLIVFFSNSNEQDAFSEVLNDMKTWQQNSIDSDFPMYIKHFINWDNVKQLSPSDYDNYLNRVKTEFNYAFESEEQYSFLEKNESLKMEDIFVILSGDMSYQNHCPICNDIPTLNIKDTEEKASRKKNCLVVIIPALFDGKTIYVKTICCKSCFEEHRVSLTKAYIEKEEKEKFHILKLESTICDPSRAFDIIKKVKISPDNWRMIEIENKTVT